VWLVQQHPGVGQAEPPSGRSVASRNAPAEAACPTQYIATGRPRNCTVSYIANIAVVEPPGELTYIAISLLGSSDRRNSSWATTRFATSSSIVVPRKTIRSRSSRE
jgi:hypothetical protein